MLSPVVTSPTHSSFSPSASTSRSSSPISGAAASSRATGPRMVVQTAPLQKIQLGTMQLASGKWVSLQIIMLDENDMPINIDPNQFDQGFLQRTHQTAMALIQAGQAANPQANSSIHCIDNKGFTHEDGSVTAHTTDTGTRWDELQANWIETYHESLAPELYDYRADFSSTSHNRNYSPLGSQHPQYQQYASNTHSQQATTSQHSAARSSSPDPWGSSTPPAVVHHSPHSSFRPVASPAAAMTTSTPPLISPTPIRSSTNRTSTPIPPHHQQSLPQPHQPRRATHTTTPLQHTVQRTDAAEGDELQEAERMRALRATTFTTARRTSELAAARVGGLQNATTMRRPASSHPETTETSSRGLTSASVYNNNVSLRHRPTRVVVSTTSIIDPSLQESV